MVVTIVLFHLIYGFISLDVNRWHYAIVSSYISLQVNAFRSMMHNDMMVGAFSHSTAVGKLRQELPDVPKYARIYFPRYSLEEAATVSHYYLRYVYNIYLLQVFCVYDSL